MVYNRNEITVLIPNFQEAKDDIANIALFAIFLKKKLIQASDPFLIL